MVEVLDPSAMSMAEFLSSVTDEYVEPPLIPQGHYRGRIRGGLIKSVGDEGKKVLEVYVLPLSPWNAEEEGIEEALENMDLEGRMLTKTFWLDKTNAWRATQFLNAVLGQQAGKPWDQRISQLTGLDVLIRVLVSMKKVQGEEEKKPTNTVGSILPLPDEE
jgi:hypothetical protein